jgi:hypothetical protein
MEYDRAFKYLDGAAEATPENADLAEIRRSLELVQALDY